MTVIDAILPGRRKAKAAARRSARHVKTQEFPEAEWTPGTLAGLSDGPSFTPVKTTGEIPVLAEAQTVLKRDMSTGLDAQPGDLTEILTRVADGLRHLDDPHGTHPFAAPVRTETQRVRDDAPEPPRIWPLPDPLPRWIPSASPEIRRRHVAAVHARLGVTGGHAGITYPDYDGNARAAGYAALMRRVSAITGTRSSMEDPSRWPKATAGPVPARRGLAIGTGCAA